MYDYRALQLSGKCLCFSAGEPVGRIERGKRQTVRICAD